MTAEARKHERQRSVYESALNTQWSWYNEYLVLVELQQDYIKQGNFTKLRLITEHETRLVQKLSKNAKQLHLYKPAFEHADSPFGSLEREIAKNHTVVVEIKNQNKQLLLKKMKKSKAEINKIKRKNGPRRSFRKQDDPVMIDITT